MIRLEPQNDLTLLLVSCSLNSDFRVVFENKDLKLGIENHITKHLKVYQNELDK